MNLFQVDHQPFNYPWLQVKVKNFFRYCFCCCILVVFLLILAQTLTTRHERRREGEEENEGPMDPWALIGKTDSSLKKMLACFAWRNTQLTPCTEVKAATKRGDTQGKKAQKRKLHVTLNDGTLPWTLVRVQWWQFIIHLKKVREREQTTNNSQTRQTDNKWTNKNKAS